MTKQDILNKLEEITKGDAIAYIDNDGDICVLVNDCYVSESGEILVDDDDYPVERDYDEDYIDWFRDFLIAHYMDVGGDCYELWTDEDEIYRLYILDRSEHYYGTLGWNPRPAVL